MLEYFWPVEKTGSRTSKHKSAIRDQNPRPRDLITAFNAALVIGNGANRFFDSREHQDLGTASEKAKGALRSPLDENDGRPRTKTQELKRPRKDYGRSEFYMISQSRNICLSVPKGTGENV